MTKPTIVFSSCEGPHQTGDWPHGKYNGGVKLQNLWVKALRNMGYEAYIATLDGQHQEWLIEHQPHINIETVRQWKVEGRDLRIVTTWLAAQMVLDLAGDKAYYFDAELGHTLQDHLGVLEARLPMLSIATHSRTQQALYMTRYGFTPSYIPEWSDVDYWTPAGDRDEYLVGYMHEGAHTEHHIQHIKTLCGMVAVPVRFTLIQGDERSVIDQMRRCSVFLGMNTGKHDLYGEGCPRAQQEAMHCGCIVVGYDVHGNREYLIDGYTGLLAKRGNPDSMAELLIWLMRNPDEREQMRATSTDYALRAFSLNDQRKRAIKEWLNL